tara:strand:+ start:1124 stop:1243 length:120 start_codon:yes stop_codon:yes gene_type:complete
LKYRLIILEIKEYLMKNYLQLFAKLNKENTHSDINKALK